jgi:hypothetical protein
MEEGPRLLGWEQEGGSSSSSNHNAKSPSKRTRKDAGAEKKHPQRARSGSPAKARRGFIEDKTIPDLIPIPAVQCVGLTGAYVCVPEEGSDDFFVKDEDEVVILGTEFTRFVKRSAGEGDTLFRGPNGRIHVSDRKDKHYLTDVANNPLVADGETIITSFVLRANRSFKQYLRSPSPIP